MAAKEFNTGAGPEFYAATPPSECLRLMLSLLACRRPRGIRILYADISRAYFYPKAIRPLYVKLPEEDVEPGEEGKCGRLKMSMYGTRDAALNCSLGYASTLLAAGYPQGQSKPLPVLQLGPERIRDCTWRRCHSRWTGRSLE